MVDTPQAVINFPGLPPVVGGRWTLSRGVLPSVCLVETLRRPAIHQQGTLVLSHGGSQTFATGCAVAECRPRKFARAGEGYRWITQIVDRRALWWRWLVDGVYNTRRADGTLDPSTTKTARELATLLLTGMGEVGYDVSQVPLDVYPAVNWQGTPAPLALENLSRAVGCEVVYNPFNDQSRVVRLGEGSDLPAGGQITPTAAYHTSNVPNSLMLVAGPTRFQFLFQLEAVGLESDGSIVPIGDLSYKPSSGWSGEWPTVFGGVAESKRALAMESVYRWWRIKRFADGSLEAPGYGSIDDIQKCLPLLPRLLGGEPPYLQGTFWPGSLKASNTAEHTRYAGPLSFDLEQGIVKAQQPLIKFASGQPEAAEMYLMGACSLRSDETGYARYAQTINVNPNGFGAHPIHREELFLAYKNTYLAGSVAEAETNLSHLTSEATAWLAARSGEYAALERRCESYRGIVPVAPDGRLGQVRFAWGRRFAETTVSQGYEFDGQEPSREERLALAKSLAARCV